MRENQMSQSESLTEWQLRIRNATAPAELLQVADEMRARSEEARRLRLVPADNTKRARVDRSRGVRSSRRDSNAR